MTAKDIAAGADGSIWVIARNKHLSKWTGGGWHKTSYAGATSLAVGADGIPIFTTVKHEIFVGKKKMNSGFKAIEVKTVGDKLIAVSQEHDLYEYIG